MMAPSAAIPQQQASSATVQAIRIQALDRSHGWATNPRNTIRIDTPAVTAIDASATSPNRLSGLGPKVTEGAGAIATHSSQGRNRPARRNAKPNDPAHQPGRPAGHINSDDHGTGPVRCSAGIIIMASVGWVGACPI